MIDKLAWVQIKDNTVLLAKSYGKDKFYIPGGKRELNETDAEALSREIQEELNVIIDKTTMEFVGIFEAQAHGQPNGVSVKMTCYSGSFIGHIKASSEIEAIRWFKYSEKNELVGVDKLIFEHLKQNGFLI